MQKSGTISVIIPNYNRPDYVREAIHSVLNQTRLPDEIVVSDNHSTKPPGDLATESDAVPIRVVKPVSPLKVDAHWLWALGQGKSDYIALLEDDNLWRSNHLEVCAGALDSFPKAGLSCSAAMEFFHLPSPIQLGINAPILKVNLLTEEPLYLDWRAALASFMFNTDSTSSTFILRRSRFDELSPKPRNLSISHDRWLWAQMSAKDGMVYCPKITALYRQHSQQLARVLNGKMHRHEQTQSSRLIIGLAKDQGMNVESAFREILPHLSSEGPRQLAGNVWRDRDMQLSQMLIPVLLQKSDLIQAWPELIGISFNLFVNALKRRCLRWVA